MRWWRVEAKRFWTEGSARSSQGVQRARVGFCLLAGVEVEVGWATGDGDGKRDCVGFVTSRAAMMRYASSRSSMFAAIGPSTPVLVARLGVGVPEMRLWEGLRP